MKNKLALTVLAVGICFGSILESLPAADPLANLTARYVTMPYYKEGKLQFLLFADQMLKNGEVIVADNPIIDIMRKNADAAKVRSEVPVLYGIDASLDEIKNFWLNHSQSEAVLASSKANINQTTRNIRGNSQVFMRTPQLDLDGFNYEAIYDKQTLNIDNNVKIRYRGENEIRPAESGQKPPGKSMSFSNVKASGESLFINYKSGEITLKGKVEVDDPKFNLKCDKIVILLDNDATDKPNPTTAGEEEDSGLGAFASKVKVKDLVCLKNVEITIKDDSPGGVAGKAGKTQKAYADKATFDLNKDLIILEEGEPRIVVGEESVRGEKITINQKQEEFNVERGCVLTMHNMSASGQIKAANQKNTPPTILTCDFVDFKYGQNVGYFTGSVKINDPKLYLTGDKMTVYLFDKNVANPAEKLNPTQFNPLNGGSKGVKSVVFDGNVSVCEKDGQGNVNLQRQAQSGKLVYNVVDEIITLTKDNPLITYNSATVSGDEIVIYPRQEQMTLPRGVNIKNNSDEAGDAAGGITAKQGNLNYGGNKLIFVGDVKVRNSQLNADAGKMIVYLKELTEQPSKKSAPGREISGDIFGSMMKQDNAAKRLERIVLIEDARLNESRGDIFGDKITILFRNAQSDSSADIKVGEAELERFICDGNFKFVNLPEQSKKDNTQPEAPTTMTADFADINLTNNIGDFVGNVKIADAETTLSCDKMVATGKLIPPGEVIANAKKINSAVDVPDRINLAAGRELEQIDCYDNVVLTRNEAGNLPTRVVGDFATYPVKQQKVFVKQKKMRPRIYRGVNWMDGEIIIVHLDNGEIEMKDFTSEVTDGKNL